jgi:hypothetical protein
MNPSVVAVTPIASSAVIRRRSLSSIRSVVANLSGCVIPGRDIKPTGHPANHSLKSTTSLSGFYNFRTLPLNNVSITVEAEAFKKTPNHTCVFLEQRISRFMHMDGMRLALQPADHEAKSPEAEL